MDSWIGGNVTIFKTYLLNYLKFMKRSKLDLAKRLNQSRKRKYDKFLTSSLYLTIMLGLCYVVYLNLPWSFHLFMRWVTKGGDVGIDKLPATFYSELNQLCLGADSTGAVKTRIHTEIAQSLGPFKCTLINGGQDWLIELRIIVPKAKG